MTPEPLRLALDLVADSEPIKGSIAGPGGECRRFEGWMELAATLEAFMRGEPPGPPPPGRAWTDATDGY